MVADAASAAAAAAAIDQRFIATLHVDGNVTDVRRCRRRSGGRRRRVLVGAVVMSRLLMIVDVMVLLLLMMIVTAARLAIHYAEVSDERSGRVLCVYVWLVWLVGVLVEC